MILSRVFLGEKINAVKIVAVLMCITGWIHKTDFQILKCKQKCLSSANYLVGYEYEMKLRCGGTSRLYCIGSIMILELSLGHGSVSGSVADPGFLGGGTKLLMAPTPDTPVSKMLYVKIKEAGPLGGRALMVPPWIRQWVGLPLFKPHYLRG